MASVPVQSIGRNPASGFSVQVPARKAVDVPVWPMVVVIYATLLPREVSIRLGENYLYMDRLALILTLPLVASSLWRGAIKFVLPDWLILFLGLWMMIAVAAVHGIERSAVTGFSVAFDAVAGYYLARVSFRSLDSIRRALILCSIGFFVSGLMLMVESISHHPIVRPFFAAVFGTIRYTSGNENISDVLVTEVRLGLMRASGSWVHPIAASLHLSTLLAVYWMSSIRGWPLWCAIAAAFLSIFAMSSAGILALAMLMGLIAYDMLTQRLSFLSWRWFTFAIILLIAAVQIFTNRGLIGLVIAFGTLDPLTGYFRQAIWQYGMISVANHPWVGIGFNAYQRASWMNTSSIDTHWLLYAVRYGLPAALSLFFACLAAIFALVRSEAHASRRDARFYRGIIMSFSVLVLMCFTVSLQGGTLTWFTILLGGCVACAQHGFTLRQATPLTERVHMQANEAAAAPGR